MNSTQPEIKRRGFLGKLALGLAGALVAGEVLRPAASIKRRSGAHLPPAFPNWAAAPSSVPAKPA